MFTLNIISGIKFHDTGSYPANGNPVVEVQVNGNGAEDKTKSPKKPQASNAYVTATRIAGNLTAIGGNADASVLPVSSN